MVQNKHRHINTAKKRIFGPNKTKIEIATGGAVVDKIGISAQNYIWKKNKNIRENSFFPYVNKYIFN